MSVKDCSTTHWLTRRDLLRTGSAAALLSVSGCVSATSTSNGSGSPAEMVARIVSAERERLVSLAGRYVGEAPITIRAFKAERSPGGPGDYYSEGDYWWPDPANPGGPYVRRDGLSNPEKFDAHRDALIRFSLIVPALAAAFSVTGDIRFARQAEQHLTAWFVDPATRMNPNLNHAQAIIGVNTGRGIGVIDTLQLVEVARAAAVLDSAHPATFRMQSGDAIRGSFGEYLTWLTTSKNGTDERDEENNHGTCWLLQAAEFARLTGDDAFPKWARNRLRTVIIPGQIAADGSQPLELSRTKPYSYALFNLDVLATLAHSLSTPDEDLWRYTAPGGGSIAGALAFMVPYIADKSAWPYPPDVQYFDDLPVRQPSLAFGALALGRPDYLALWNTLEPDPKVGEVIRNYPVRQPVLWV